MIASLLSAAMTAGLSIFFFLVADVASKELVGVTAVSPHGSYEVRVPSHGVD